MATILFADDSASIREFIQEELENENHRVLLRRDGREAIEIVRRERPDLAILDILMPNVNGFEAAVSIAEIGPETAVIFFTNNRDLCLRDSRSALAAACVEKSADHTVLNRTISSVLTERDRCDKGSVTNMRHRTVVD